MSNPTMTIREVYYDLRNHGFKISTQKLADGMASGLYPFGSVLNIGETGKRTFQILRVDYERWKSKYVLRRSDPETNVAPPAPTIDSNWEIISTRTYTQEDKDIMWEVIIRSWSRRAPSSDDNL